MLGEFEGSIEEFIECLGSQKNGPIGVLKKPRGRTFVQLYWSSGQGKDRWFMDVAHISKGGEHYLITAKDAPRHISYLMRYDGYEMFLDDLSEPSKYVKGNDNEEESTTSI
jgi:hypothetical protein